MKPAEGSLKVEGYLGYLDKEMTIMGILSAFCVASLAVSIKLLTSRDALRADQIARSGPVATVLFLVMLLLSAFSFYQQRSNLAWYYGQISLQDAGHLTGKSVRE